jgi:hypothetical protein
LELFWEKFFKNKQNMPDETCPVAIRLRKEGFDLKMMAEIL